MERVDDELHIDYDSIQAPQFVDFHAMSMIEDDEEDPAPKFFELKEYVDKKEENFDLGFGDEERQISEQQNEDNAIRVPEPGSVAGNQIEGNTSDDIEVVEITNFRDHKEARINQETRETPEGGSNDESRNDSPDLFALSSSLIESLIAEVDALTINTPSKNDSEVPPITLDTGIAAHEMPIEGDSEIVEPVPNAAGIQDEEGRAADVSTNDDQTAEDERIQALDLTNNNTENPRSEETIQEQEVEHPLSGDLVHEQEVQTSHATEIIHELELQSSNSAETIQEHELEVALAADTNQDVELEHPLPDATETIQGLEVVNVERLNPTVPDIHGSQVLLIQSPTEVPTVRGEYHQGFGNTTGRTGIPPEMCKKLMNRGVTVPRPFNFHTVRHRPDYPAPEEEKKHPGFGFRARPAPMKVLHGGITGLKDKPEVKPTVAIAPHFASDDRIRSRHMRASQAPSCIKENQDPKLGDVSRRPGFRSVPSTPGRSNSSAGRGRSPSPAFVRPADKPATIMKPFSFEEREKARKRVKEEKIRQQELGEDDIKRHVFHANPLPSFKPNLPPKNPIPVTTPAPFQLKVDERGTKHQEIFRKKLEEEERLRREQATFYANPPNVIFKQPFEPEPSNKAPTEPMNFELNSDRRAQERDFFDSQLREKELFEQEQREQEEANRLLLEQKQAQELRKQLVHKAQPIKGTRAFEVKHSSKPLTHPMSPAFAPLPSQRRNLHQINNNVQASPQ